jgi:nucleoside-diphosphate-sugar epimerase
MEKTLRAAPFAAKHILITGATGYMGALIVASLLRDTAAQITCLTRSVHDRQALLDPVIEEWEAQAHGCWSDAVENRVHQMALPADLADVADLAQQLAGVDEIIHCAGCLDYYDIPKLQAVNVSYTAHLLVLARRLSIKRFVYISTAYSSGYQSHPTLEAALPDPPSDPTQYTRTKREAERLVAASGVPFVVIRPSILIGTSDTGRYSGKRYGLYQQWMGLERLACDRYHAAFHTVAPGQPLNVLHQDAFCQAFKLAYPWLPDGAYMNLVSNPRTSPSMRDLWEMWFEVTRPKTVYYYSSFDEVPFKDIPTRQRAYLTFAQVNLQIASHRWQFETRWLELLRGKGLSFVDATIDSVRVCQDRFVASSELIGSYLTRHAAELAPHPQVVEVAPARAMVELEMVTV